MDQVKNQERRITVDGKTITVKVLEDAAGHWLLEIVDEHGNSTCWRDVFGTAQEAFNAAAIAVQEEGIEAFMGPAKIQKN